MSRTATGFDTILFDLDGTLVETAPDLTAALNHTLIHFGLEKLNIADVRRMIGDGAKKLLRLGFESQGRELDDATDKAAFDILLAYYWEHIAVDSFVFPGVVRCLDDLAQQNCQLAVCSNKPEAFSIKLLQELNLADRFVTIRGGDSYAKRKPDPLHIRQTIADAGGNISRAVMIGDSDNDRAAARNAGIPVVLVSFGYTEIPARELDANCVIDHFDQLIPALTQLA